MVLVFRREKNFSRKAVIFSEEGGGSVVQKKKN